MTSLVRVGLLAALGAALALGGCGTGAVEPVEPVELVPDGGATAPAQAPSRTVPVRPATDALEPAAGAPPAPVRLEVTDLGIDVPVRPTGTASDGSMELPDSAAEAGWYRFGPAPADPNGAVVVAAHVDDATGVGPFAVLVDVAEGTGLTVVDDAGTTHNYTVTDVRSIAKAQVPFAEIFDRTGEPRLVLVTCGGRWDASVSSYTDNVVVTAAPVT